MYEPVQNVHRQIQRKGYMILLETHRFVLGYYLISYISKSPSRNYRSYFPFPS